MRNLKFWTHTFFSYVLLVCAEQNQSEEEHCQKSEGESYCVQKSTSSRNCIELTKNHLGPQDPSWFIIVPQGRLGNHIVGYSVIQALAATLGVRPLLSKETDEYLRKYFEIKHDISIYEDTFCNLEKLENFQMTYFEGSIDEIVKNKNYHK